MIHIFNIYMRAATLANVVTSDVQALKESLIMGTLFNIDLDWPIQQTPPESNWRIWRAFLKNLLLAGGSKVKANYQLCSWRSTRIQWRWVGNNQGVLDSFDGTTYTVTKDIRLDMICKKKQMTFMGKNDAC